MSEYNVNQLSVNENLISRKQAIEKVKAYKIFAPTDGVEKTLNAVIEAIAHSIAGLPAADVVEVVRCRECVMWDGSFTLNGQKKCLNMTFCTDGDFYCGWGSKE